MKTLCNKPQYFDENKFFAHGVRYARNESIPSGFLEITYNFWDVGENPKVFDKKFDEKS